MLKEGGYSLGGEQSGHIILPHLATTGDGQLTAIALLSEVKKSGKSLSALAEIMKKYPQVTKNIYADSLDKQMLTSDEIINNIITNAVTELKNKGRIIVRPSGTEPLIRITVESDDEKEAEQICTSISEKITTRLNKLKTSV
jgi:phosphoglucosamine mutase